MPSIKSSIKSTGLSFLAASSYFQQSSCSSFIQPSFEHSIPLEKRISCTPECPKGFYVDQVQMPDCSWNCITYTSKTLQVVPSIIAGIATITAGLIGYAATRRATPHTGNVRRDEISNPFESLITELFGSLDSPNITYVDAANGTLMGMLDQHHIEIQDDGAAITGFINLLETPRLARRADMLTGAKVIFENAAVSGKIQVRKFSDSEAQKIGNRVSTNFESVCNHYGRAMCDCVRSGHGDGWTASIRVEGQANNNGKYQAISCPSGCDVSSREL